MLRPLPLYAGAPIAVVAPASAPRDLNRYREGLAQLRRVYDVRSAWAPGHEQGYLAAPDALRVQGLHKAIRSPAIRAVICVRGGYGCLRLLPHLDWALARDHPTLLVGYSDVTALHLAFYARVGWTGLSGPVVTEWAEAKDDTIGPFRTLAEGGTPSLGSDTLQTLSPGTAVGRVLGGNLSVLTRLLGTPYEPDWTGAILVLEDVAEAPYRVDRMLGHLQHTGVLDAVSGVVLGHFRVDDSAIDSPTLSLDDVFAQYFQDRRYPVVTDLNYGHVLPRCTLPVGAPVRLVASQSTACIHVLNPAVEP